MRLLNLFAFIFASITLFATNYTSVSNGNWSTYTTWSPIGVPQSGDIVVINTNVILDDQYTQSGYWSVNAGGSITINANGSLTAGTNVLGIAIQNGGNITNNGILTLPQIGIYSGTLTNNDTCYFTSLIYNLDVFNNYGAVLQVDSFFTSGNFTNNANAYIFADSLYNNGTISNSGTIEVQDMYNNNNFYNNNYFVFDRFYNNKILYNYGNIVGNIDATNAGIWNNFTNSMVEIINSFTNADTVNSDKAHLTIDGQMFIGDSFLNLDTITGGNNGFINIENETYNGGYMDGTFQFCDQTPTVTNPPIIDFNVGFIGSNITYCISKIDETQIAESIIICPNPSTNFINIESIFSITAVKIYNTIGKEVLNSTSKIIDVSILSKGIYTAKIYSNNNIFTKKFIVN